MRLCIDTQRTQAERLSTATENSKWVGGFEGEAGACDGVVDGKHRGVEHEAGGGGVVEVMAVEFVAEDGGVEACCF